MLRSLSDKPSRPPRASGQRRQRAQLALVVDHRRDRLLGQDQVLYRTDDDRVIAAVVFAPQLALDDRRGLGQQRVA